MSSECEEISESEPLVMSQMEEDSQMFTAEYKDGQLHIVEVTPFDKREKAESPASSRQETSHQYEGDSVSHSEPSSEADTKYLQILDSDKGAVHLDLLNFTLVKSADGTNTYKMVTDSVTDEGGTTITCVLSDDVDDNQESSYVMVTEDDTDPYIYLQTSEMQALQQHATETTQTPPTNRSENTALSEPALTPLQILEKTKKLKKAKALLRSLGRRRGRGGRSAGYFPPPTELLSSPNFKLYLYNCKMCSFKCNAVKEMSAHKAEEHGSGAPRGSRGASLQCARCPYRGHTHAQLMKHVRENHTKDAIIASSVKLDSEEVEAADVLVCGACGFESGDRALFRKHIEDDHGAVTTV